MLDMVTTAADFAAAESRARSHLIVVIQEAIEHPLLPFSWTTGPPFTLESVNNQTGDCALVRRVTTEGDLKLQPVRAPRTYHDEVRESVSTLNSFRPPHMQVGSASVTMALTDIDAARSYRARLASSRGADRIGDYINGTPSRMRARETSRPGQVPPWFHSRIAAIHRVCRHLGVMSQQHSQASVQTTIIRARNRIRGARRA